MPGLMASYRGQLWVDVAHAVPHGPRRTAIPLVNSRSATNCYNSADRNNTDYDNMTLLKLAALDREDLQVLSAHLQDAVVKVEDMAFLPNKHCFVAMTNRFDWESVHTQKKPRHFQRRRSALRCERVLGAQVQNIPQAKKDTVLELLAVDFEPVKEQEPEGYISFLFAGGGTIRLHVECIEVELSDLGPAWHTKRRPEHELGPEGALSGESEKP